MPLSSAVLRSLILLLVLVGSGGCAASRAGASLDTPASSSLPVLDALYAAAIRQSAVVAPGDILPLRPLTPGPDGTVTLTTWAACRGDGGPNKCGSYVPGDVTLKWDVWVGSDEEFASACRALRGDLDLRISQLLGMPAPRTSMPPGGYEKQFVTFSGVPVGKVFRPCTDPRVDTDRCSTTLPATLPPDAPAGYYKWFTNQAMSSWRITAPAEAPDGFPWTRLGYTYNWAPNAASRYGMSEYVLAGSLAPIPVRVAAVRTASDYCGRQ
jgi:hypothetical protein